MMKAALYARVSTARQAEKQLSIPDQIGQMRKWCQNAGYDVIAEFKDEGLSATDDRRPEFQKMLTQAYAKPPAFDVIIVHSLSRFFRDHLELGIHDKNLRKNKVKLISITQQTDDDAHGELIRTINAVFDGYQSKETAKHTLRSMLENARQGFHNGSKPPFGFMVKDIKLEGRKDAKKILEIDLEEAEVVKKMFNLYLETSNGVKGVAAYLNERDILRRGNLWGNTTIHEILTNRLYMGVRVFNKNHWKSGELKPESEWIKVPIEPIVSEDIFTLVQEKLKSRSPAMTHPRRLSSPRLLTGILKCGVCGANMTMATGKGEGGTYYYYRCSTKTRKHAKLCSSRPVRMDEFDKSILEALANVVFTPERVEAMMLELRRMLRTDGDVDLQTLKRRHEALQVKLKNAYRAIANGIEVDQFFKEELENMKRLEAEVSAKIANYQDSPQAVVDAIDRREVEEFCATLKRDLLDTSKPFSKQYLQQLVKEIVLTDGVARIRGGHRPLAGAIRLSAEKKNPITSKKVIGFNSVWRPRDDSNVRPLP